MSVTIVRALLLTTVAATAACHAPAPPPEADPASRRDTQLGPVVGYVGGYGSHVWAGIPYARPPVGDLRWRAPEPPEKWSDTRAALRSGSPCVQYASPFGGVEDARPGTPVGSEDCLTLNVWAPRL